MTAGSQTPRLAVGGCHFASDFSTMLVQPVKRDYIRANLDEHRPGTGNSRVGPLRVSRPRLRLQDGRGELVHIAVTSIGDLSAQHVGTRVTQGVEMNGNGMIVGVAGSSRNDCVFRANAVSVKPVIVRPDRRAEFVDGLVCSLLTDDLATVVRGGKDVAVNRRFAAAANCLPDAQVGIAWKYDLPGAALQSKDGAARVLIGLRLRVNVLEETWENDFNTEAIGGNVPVAWINVVRSVTAFEPRGVWSETFTDLFLQDLEDSPSFKIISRLILQEPDEFDLPSILEQDRGQTAHVIDVVVRKDQGGDPVDSQVVA